MSSSKTYSLLWEKSLITNVRKTHNSWAKGFDLTSASPEVIERFACYSDRILKNHVSSYNTSIIESLIRYDLAFMDSDIIRIGERNYKAIDLSGVDRKSLLTKHKMVQLIESNPEKPLLINYLEKLTIKDYERELVFLATSQFDRLVEKYKLQKSVDLQFVLQIYATTTSPLDLVKFIFFTMAQQAPLKKEPLFRALFNFLSNQSLDDLYFYLKQK